MSDEQRPLDPSAVPAPAAPQGGAAPAPQNAGVGAQSAGAAPAAKKTKKKNSSGLSTFIKVSIILLAGLTIASISLLFIGDFQGKFERVLSTFALFAVFVVFTALDTRREQKSEWYAPVALIANAYILGLLLIVIWMTPYSAFSLLAEIMWKSLFVIAVTRVVILGCQFLLSIGAKLPHLVTRAAFVTSVLAVLSGILFTAPVGVEAFNLTIPDLYWKIATSLLILTALALSITLLLRWSYGAGDRERARTEAARAGVTTGPAAPYRAQAPQQPTQQAARPAAPTSTPETQHSQSQAPQRPLLPWPTFADGRPLPARPDGQPDFSVPGAPAPPQH